MNKFTLFLWFTIIFSQLIFPFNPGFMSALALGIMINFIDSIMFNNKLEELKNGR